MLQCGPILTLIATWVGIGMFDTSGRDGWVMGAILGTDTMLNRLTLMLLVGALAACESPTTTPARDALPNYLYEPTLPE